MVDLVVKCGHCFNTMERGFEIRVLDDTNTWSLIGPGYESSSEVYTVDSWMGPDHGIYSWGNALVMGRLDGEVFWVGC